MSKVRMFVLIGDSQAVGFDQSEATLPDAAKTFDFGQSYIWNGKYWGQIDPGQNTGGPNTPNTWGLETPIAARLRSELPDEIHLWIKVGKGGTTAADWQPGGVWFIKATETIKSAMASGNWPAPEAVFISLGTNDAVSETTSSEISHNLETLLSAIREEWMRDPFGHIVMARPHDSTALMYSQAVREQIWTLDQGDPYMESIRTIDAERATDNVHWNANGLWDVGTRLADEWLF